MPEGIELTTPVGEVLWDIFAIFKAGGWIAFVAVVFGGTLLIHGWPQFMRPKKGSS